MANLFRPHYTKVDPRTGERVRHRAKYWYGQFRTSEKQLRRVKLSRNKTAAQQMLNELVRKEELKKIGIVNPFEGEQKRPLVEHVADWRASLVASGSTAKHVSHTVGCVTRVFEACGFIRLTDLSAVSVEQYLAAIRQPGHPLPPLDADKDSFTKSELTALLGMKKPALSKLISEHRIEAIGSGKARRYPRASAEKLMAMRASGRSVRTSNFSLGAVKQFCRWLVQNRRMSDNPLAHVSMNNAKGDRRHGRRKLTLAELHRLIAAASGSDDAYRGLCGTDRAMLYRLACLSGFRVSELASLTPTAFDLGNDPPTVTLAGENAKNGQTAVQPLPHDVARALQTYLAGKPHDAPVWPGTWTKRAATMIRRDLHAASIAYVVDGPDGPMHADFHGLRHSYIALLDQCGATLKEAMQLARHSDPKLTAAVYGRAQLHDLGAAVNRLPSLFPGDSSEAQILRATGTDQLAPQLAPAVDPRCEILRIADTTSTGEPVVKSSAESLEGEGLENGCDGLMPSESSASCRARTYDPLIKSQKVPTHKSNRSITYAGSQSQLAPQLALDRPADALLQRVIDAWSELPAHVREAIVKLAER